MSKARKGIVAITDAKRLGEKSGAPLIVIFALEPPNAERFTVTTWGRSRKLCKLAAWFGDQFAAAVLNGDVGPPASEPTDLPEFPCQRLSASEPQSPTVKGEKSKAAEGKVVD